VAVTKNAVLGIVHPGDRLTYTLAIANLGNEIATGVRITDVLPLYTAYASASDGGVETSPGSGIVVWPPFDLSAGQSVTRALAVDVAGLLPDGLRSLTNTVIALEDGSHGIDPNPDNNVYTHTTSLERAPALSIAKHGPDTAMVGQVVSYTFTITNDPSAGDGSSIRVLSVWDDRAGTASYVSGDDGDDLLEVGEAWVFRVWYAIGRNELSPLVNTGTVSGEDLEGDALTASAVHSTSLEYAPGLSVIKTAPKTARLGGTVVYSFTVSNVAFTPTWLGTPTSVGVPGSMRALGQGDGSPIKQVTVTDDLLGSPPYIGGDDGDGLLEIGETWLYVASHTVQDTDPDPLVNRVIAAGLDLRDRPVQGTASHSLDIEHVPVLETVVDGPSAAKIGETIVFTYAVLHSQDSDGSPVRQLAVADSVAGAAHYIGGDDGDGRLSENETWIYGASYVVQPTDWNPLIGLVTVSGTDRDGTAVTAYDRHLTIITDALSAVYLPIISQGE
jgi:uncharacterized repeat protein (TIGR01451 family)